MSNNNSGKVELRDEIAKALLLEKGGITDHPSPANEHYYFYNEIEDYDTEKVIIEQRINFEEQIKNIEKLISSKVNEVEKAYGGCKKCYGKGYSTGAEMWAAKGKQWGERNKMVFCDCDRGKQLEDRIRTLKESKLDQLSKEINDV